MNNQDMPANPMFSSEGMPCMTRVEGGDPNDQHAVNGETKREKAFWQVYSAMIGGLTANTKSGEQSFDSIASAALSATKAGFKALEQGE